MLPELAIIGVASACCNPYTEYARNEKTSPGIAGENILKTVRLTVALQKIINSQIMLQAGKKSAPPHKLLT